jgi:hypothetical protein
MSMASWLNEETGAKWHARSGSADRSRQWRGAASAMWAGWGGRPSPAPWTGRSAQSPRRWTRTPRRRRPPAYPAAGQRRDPEQGQADETLVGRIIRRGTARAWAQVRELPRAGLPVHLVPAKA